ncbi:hypothetical protein K438DRAFT_1946341 [Mycena galopus ATCC 62051]|nr:hypothetical protein K438DRAFT_1946341 [Mycena galopus ATCC 62051]
MPGPRTFNTLPVARKRVRKIIVAVDLVGMQVECRKVDIAITLAALEVGAGYTPGIYTNENLARLQVEGFFNSHWKKSPPFKGAVEIWNSMCETYHDHDQDSPAESPPCTASPPPESHPYLAPSVPLSPRPICGTVPRTQRTPRATTSVPPVLATASVSHRALGSVSTVLTSTPRPSPVRASAVRSIPIVPSTQRPGEWQTGDIPWGIGGTLLLFEDRHDLIDHVYSERLSPVCIKESRDRSHLEGFVWMPPDRSDCMAGGGAE